MNWMSDWNSKITFAKLLLRVVKKWRHSLLGKESRILRRDCKSIFIKMCEDGGSVKNFRRLHDVIYGWPLICYITIQSLRNSEIDLQFTKNTLNCCHIRAQFHQRSTYSFYARRSQKYKKYCYGKSSVSFHSFGICGRKSCTLMKLSPIVNFINVKHTNFSYERVFRKLLLHTCN